MDITAAAVKAMYTTNAMTPLKTLSRSALRAFRMSPTCPAAVLGLVAFATGVVGRNDLSCSNVALVDSRRDCGGGQGVDGGKERGQRY